MSSFPDRFQVRATHSLAHHLICLCSKIADSFFIIVKGKLLKNSLVHLPGNEWSP